MTEYLEKAALVRILRAKAEMGRLSEYSVCFDNVAKMIELLPAADVAEVKHGKWVEPHWRNSVSCANCSICGAEAYHYDFHGVQKTYRYCPNCGAKMGAEG